MELILTVKGVTAAKKCFDHGFFLVGVVIFGGKESIRGGFIRGDGFIFDSRGGCGSGGDFTFNIYRER